jgi:hypothetical protein
MYRGEFLRAAGDKDEGNVKQGFDPGMEWVSIHKQE